ncbi:hypothetical protein BCR34DRAFT_587394 [Clohesyomyces aquaticus]|uniref:RlpA-like double-psi beta-barrel-protein domain-containing protein-containing protein n=1 Tax=Clohesyomyces aquaticus TaxID=1231657 RepID=A0A1Y1ZPU1_9PLEO|nr:hypothetical protein BCR34DRAFT_587394 [Clohesyomyces aquaticus]
MKTSNVLVSALFGSLVAAAPLAKRDYVTKTQLVVETIVVYTTVWDNAPVAHATSAPGLFYEKPSSKAAQHTPAYTPPAAPSSKVAPRPPPSSVAPVPTPAYTPPPRSQAPPAPPSSAAPVPVPSPVYSPPPAPVSSAAPATSSAAPNGNYGGGANKRHGDITIYDNFGTEGACGEKLTDDMPIVALAKSAWGESTHDIMTGKSTNPWCGKSITIQYTHPSGETKTTQAKIMDLCPGCTGAYDIDLSHASWAALGLTEITRLQADWWLN